MVAVNVLTTNFGEFRAPEWINDVPTVTNMKLNEETGDCVAVRDVDASTPQGAAFWRWFDSCETRSARLYETGAELDRDMFINDPRPF